MILPIKKYKIYERKGRLSLMIEDKKTLSILETNILYLIVGFALITLGAKAQSKEVYTGLLITEYLIILLPTLLYLKLKGYSVKENLRLNKISLKQALLVVLIVIFSYPVAVFFNFIGIIVLSKFTETRANLVPIPSGLMEYLIGFIVIALTPGICEEAMFRGMIMSSYNSLGKRKAIIYSAILFGLFHFNLQNLLGPIYLGILFGIVAYKTNSLFPTIIGHTVNNTIALTIGYFLTKGDQGVEIPMDTVSIPQGEQIIFGLLGLGLIALVFGLVVYRLIKLLPTSHEKEIIQINSFTRGEYFTQDMNMRKGLNIIEGFPILITIIIFIVLNYKYLFL